nr:YkyB family protein [Lottiidibacillus patelloidae]
MPSNKANLPSVNEIAEAIYTINRHAKTAPNPKYLYSLKRMAIEKLISEKKAEKVGIQLSPNPKYSKQQLDVLIKIENYYFHIPPAKAKRYI